MSTASYDFLRSSVQTVPLYVPEYTPPPPSSEQTEDEDGNLIPVLEPPAELPEGVNPWSDPNRGDRVLSREAQGCGERLSGLGRAWLKH